eukprot:scpid90557/ scgid9852/ 
MHPNTKWRPSVGRTANLLTEKRVPLPTANRFTSLQVEVLPDLEYGPVSGKPEDQEARDSYTPACHAKSSQVSEITNVISNKDHDLFRIKGLINSHQATFLIDSGSTHDFLSEQFARNHKIKQVQTSDTFHVTLADGSMSERPLCKTSDLKLTIDSHGERQSFTIFPLHRYDAILGKPWLTRYNPCIDFRTNKIKLSSLSSPITAAASVPQDQHSPTLVESMLLSGGRASRELRRGGKGILAWVSPINGIHASPTVDVKGERWHELD